MFGRRLRSVLVFAALAAALARLAQALRGGPIAPSSHHSTVSDASVADRLDSASAPADSVEVLPADEGADPPIVPGTLFDREPVPVATQEQVAPSAGEASPTTATTMTDDPGGTDATDSVNRWEHPLDGGCPDGYPVKAKLKSGIYHLPGMSAYLRTAPDRCYPDAAAAEADGLRPAKR